VAAVVTVLPSASGSDAAAVLKANQSFYDAFENGDIDLMSAVWLDGPHAASVSCVHPGWSPLHGREQVLRSWSVIMANTAYIQFVLTDVAVDVAGDVAVVTCGENVLTDLPTIDDDGTPGLAGGRAVATNVFRRSAGQWRLWVHHASPVLTRADEDEA
jgi:ketosteroid isomerase-like protein